MKITKTNDEIYVEFLNLFIRLAKEKSVNPETLSFIHKAVKEKIKRSSNTEQSFCCDSCNYTSNLSNFKITINSETNKITSQCPKCNHICDSL